MPTDEDFLVAVEQVLEEHLLPTPGVAVVQRTRDAMLAALGPLVGQLRAAAPGQRAAIHAEAFRDGRGGVTAAKLVRDRIPMIAAGHGQRLTIRTAEPGERRTLLRDKLGEEVAEVLDAQTTGAALEELADVLEVVYALAADLGAAPEKLDIIREVKFEARGGFALGLVLSRDSGDQLPDSRRDIETMDERVTVRVLLLFGDQAEIVADVPAGERAEPQRYPAADIAAAVGLPVTDLPGERLTADVGDDGRLSGWRRA